MKRKYLEEASEKGLITESQVDPLWEFLEAKEARLSIHTLLLYLGCGIAVLAMGQLWSDFHPQFPATISTVYMVFLFALSGFHPFFLMLGALMSGVLCADLQGLSAPDSLPLFVCSLISFGCFAYKRYPPLLLISSFCLYAAFVTHLGDSEFRGFGLALAYVSSAIIVDYKRFHKAAFWIYVGSLPTYYSYAFDLFWLPGTLKSGILGLSLDFVLLAIAARLNRVILAAFAGFGLAAFCFIRAEKLFGGTIYFPISLTCIGALLILAGTQYRKLFQQDPKTPSRES